MRDKSGVLDPPLGVASNEEEVIIGTMGGEDALSLSGVEGGKGGGDESRCSSISSKTLLSIFGGRDFLRRRRRSRWVGGEGGSMASDAAAPERTRCDVELKYPMEFRPDVVGIEKTDTVGERGKGSIGEGERAWGRAGTGGGDE